MLDAYPQSLPPSKVRATTGLVVLPLHTSTAGLVATVVGEGVVAGLGAVVVGLAVVVVVMVGFVVLGFGAVVDVVGDVEGVIVVVVDEVTALVDVLLDETVVDDVSVDDGAAVEVAVVVGWVLPAPPHPASASATTAKATWRRIARSFRAQVTPGSRGDHGRKSSGPQTIVGPLSWAPRRARGSRR